MSRYNTNSNEREQNPPPPTSSFSKRHQMLDEQKVRKVRQVISAADHAEFEKHYSFVMPSTSNSNKSTCWQDRMVQHYHSHLDKEYVLADLTTRPGQVGLRWRTQDEVKRGKGQETCGNKHCPSYQQQQEQYAHHPAAAAQAVEQLRVYIQSSASTTVTTEDEEQVLLEKLTHGLGLYDYEVPFTYQEQEQQKESKQTKTELVKLRLCLRCAPLLFLKKQTPVNNNCALEARQARRKFECCGDDGGNDEQIDKVEKKKAAAVIEIDNANDNGNKRPYSYYHSAGSSFSTDEKERRNRRKKKKRRKEDSWIVLGVVSSSVFAYPMVLGPVAFVPILFSWNLTVAVWDAS